MQKNPSYEKKEKLESLLNSFRGQQDSGIYKLFLEQYANRKEGYWSDILQDQFINGYYPKIEGGTNDSDDARAALLNKGPHNLGGFFYDVFGTTILTQRRYYYNGYEAISRELKELFTSGNIVLMNYEAQGRAHVVTLWGAEYDEKGKLRAVYLTDSDDLAENGMVRYKVVDSDGRAIASTRADGKGSLIDVLQILSPGKEIWEHNLKQGQEELELVWNNTDLVYNGKTQRPRVTASNLRSNDRVQLTVNEYATAVGDYKATVRLSADYNQEGNVDFAIKVFGVNQEKVNGTITLKVNGAPLPESVEIKNGRTAFCTWSSPSKGAHCIVAEFTPAQDQIGKNYVNSESASFVIDLGKREQAPFSIRAVGEKTFGDAAFILETEGGSGEGAIHYWTNENDVISVSGAAVTIKGTGTATVMAIKTAKVVLDDRLNPENIEKISYKSTEGSVAAVSEKGKIRAKKAGTAYIKIKIILKDGSSKTVKMKVRVTA